MIVQLDRLIEEKKNSFDDPLAEDFEEYRELIDVNLLKVYNKYKAVFSKKIADIFIELLLDRDFKIELKKDVDFESLYLFLLY